MTPLPAGLDKNQLLAWRLDRATFAPTWDSGEGSYRSGGRWNSPGTRVVYASVDPATAILEVAVHKTFAVLDTVPHVLTSFEVLDPKQILIVNPDDVPNPNWLFPGTPGAGQQQFGDSLLAKHPFVLMPSAVSRHSWNLLLNSTTAIGQYKLISQEKFALDTRLHPPQTLPKSVPAASSGGAGGPAS